MRRTLLWVGNHALAIAGCVMFALPFGSMILTSLKQNDEMFAGRTLPEVPRGEGTSPYRAPTAFPEVERPPGVAVAAWDAAASAGSAAAFARAREIDPARVAALDDETFRADMERGIWFRVASRIPAAAWEGGREAVVTAAAARVNPRDVISVFDELYRAVRIGDVSVYDQPLKQFVLGGSDGVLDDWRVVAGDGELVPGTFEPGHARRLEYDLRQTDAVTLRLDFDLPIPPERFRRIVVPLRGDRTWYGVDAVVWIDGVPRVSEHPRFLRTAQWMNLTLQLPGPDDEQVGLKEHIRLLRADVTSTDTPVNRIEITIRRSPRGVLASRKLSANYRETFLRVPFWKYVFNSALLVLLNVLGALLVCPLVAYAFARLKWPGRDVFFALLLATLMLPFPVTMIPVFQIFKAVGWHDTLKPLFVTSFFGNAFFIFLLRQFMKGIPRDLERAARMDGCSFFGVYRHVILPLIKPSLAAIAVFEFQATWNNFMGPLIYVSSQDLYPLALGLFEFRQLYRSDYGALMAGSLLMTLPVILVFLLAQRYFIQGVTLTGLKG